MAYLNLILERYLILILLLIITLLNNFSDNFRSKMLSLAILNLADIKITQVAPRVEPKSQIGLFL